MARHQNELMRLELLAASEVCSSSRMGKKHKSSLIDVHQARVRMLFGECFKVPKPEISMSQQQIARRSQPSYSLCRSIKNWLVFCLSVVGAGAALAQVPTVDPAEGARFAQAHCASCYGANGQSASASFPRLAGQNEVYLVKQLQDFASGERKSPTMRAKVALMNEQLVRSLAAYYASQKAANTPSDDRLLMAVGQYIYERGNVHSGLSACLSCHGTRGWGAETMPRLAGQHPAYIEMQLRHFHDRGRSNDSAVMGVVSKRMTDLETKAVATYLGALE